jgi:hypothetical protein
MRELMRLGRSLRKRHAEHAATFWPAFFDGYVGDDDALREALKRHERRERVRNTVHALGYSRF